MKWVQTEAKSLDSFTLSRESSVSATLPFQLTYFDVNFNKVLISPMGFITFISSEPNVKTASIVVYLNNSEILKDILHCIVTFGSTNENLDDFVVKWNHSYETILHKDGRIDIKYYNVQRK